jgi:hypothetical protein
MGLADREYMKKEYQEDRRYRKEYRDTHNDRKMPSYRVYKFRRFILEIKDKIRRIIRR